MATMAIESRYTGQERIIAVAVQDGGASKVYVRIAPRAGRVGELIVAPFEIAELDGLPLAGTTVTATVQEEVANGLADLRLEFLHGGGQVVTKRVWVRASSEHPALGFGASLKELGWDEACPLGTGEAIFRKLMGATFAGGPTAFTIPTIPAVAR